MRIRIRRSKQDPSKQDVFLVQENGWEIADTVLQKLWDDEQRAQLEFNLDDSPQTPVHVQKRFCPKRTSNFVVEFRDLGHAYTYNITNGVAQWFFETLPRYFRHYQHRKTIPIDLKTYQHKFFSDALICLDRNTLDNLAALFSGRSGGWLCGDGGGHDHYLVRVYLELDMNCQDLNDLDIKHTMHMICGNARTVDVFHGFCGNKLKDQFSLTQIYWEDKGHSRKSMTPGTSYSYQTVKTGNMLVKDLGWSAGKDNTIWLCGGERSREALLKEMLSWEVGQQHKGQGS